MAAACDPFLAATDVADYLVEKGVPFREAHHLTGGLVRRCLEKGEDLAEVPLEDLRALSPAFDDGYCALDDPPRSWRASARAAAPRPSACASSSSGRARSPRAPAADRRRLRPAPPPVRVGRRSPLEPVRPAVRPLAAGASETSSGVERHAPARATGAVIEPLTRA